MRTFVIGDIHGGLRSYQQVLERSGFDNSKDKIIFLGDYVDGWSESAELVQELIELQEEAEGRHVFLKGNHDEWCNEWLTTGVRKAMWVMQGGQATFDSYVRTGHLADHKHRMFFYKLNNYYIDEQNRGFVHGGFISRKGLGHEAYASDYYWDRDLWNLALLSHGRVHMEDGTPQGRRFEKHKEIYIGHTATPNWNCKPHLPEFENPLQEAKNGPIVVPMNRCNVWNMDTGGGFYGKLSMMDIDTKEVFQSDWMKDLYPEEKGRG